MSPAGVRVTLPSGFWQGEFHHRGAELRPLNGADEEWLAESGATLSPVDRTTALLTRCMMRLDGCERVDAPAIEALTIGDREALLLQLRRLTLGERIQCVLECPSVDCGERMDLEINVTDLLLAPYADPRPSYESLVDVEGAPRYRVRFRLPTGADQAAAVRAAADDPLAGDQSLLQRCIERVTDAAGDVLTDWPMSLADDVASRMQELDPQAELRLNLRCPVCGHAFSTLFDTAAYLFQEISDHAAQLYRQVHLLALHYHWSESEIMGMTAQKRRRYLGLLLDSLSDVRQQGAWS